MHLVLTDLFLNSCNIISVRFSKFNRVEIFVQHLNGVGGVSWVNPEILMNLYWSCPRLEGEVSGPHPNLQQIEHCRNNK